MSEYDYRDRRAVVTGAARGVGAALLEVLSELDVGHVTVLDREAPTGKHDDFLQVDLAEEASVRDALGKIDGPVHALFNNAGVAGTLPVRTVMAVNYLAVRRLTERISAQMPQGGAIAITASIAGVFTPIASPR